MRLDTLRLANWNVALPLSESRRARIREHINAVGADVWVFTEMHDGCITGLANAHSSAIGRDGLHGPEHRWVTIASQLAIEPLKTSDAARTAAVRVHPAGNDPFVVYGTVLPWMGSSWRGLSSKGGVAFRESLMLQVQDWRELKTAFPEDEMFVMGDFNQDLVGSRYYGSRANRECLETSLQDVGLVPLTAGADDPVHRDSPPCACIDHICARSDSGWIAVRTERWPDAEKPVTGLSDHFGIGVTLQRRRE